MMSVRSRTIQKRVSQGDYLSLGARLTTEGVNFALFSEHARQVYLVLFDSTGRNVTDKIALRRTHNIWHGHVAGIGANQQYGYQVEGEYNPAFGLRFNPHKLLIDPYAKALSSIFHNKNGLFYGYFYRNPKKDLSFDSRESTSIMPRSIVIDDTFEWEGDSLLRIPWEELRIYEVHLKGFTAHRSSGVSHPGTYLGFIEKIPYLKKLGINAVELLPIHEAYTNDTLRRHHLTDYWKYNSIAFFSPTLSYCSQAEPGAQVREFKTLVKALHKAGIEILLDVVFNHTGEGDELGPTLSFRGIDNLVYYKLRGGDSDPYRFYNNISGCGNVLNVQHPAVERLIIDALRYWVVQMHIDGFRFDLATILLTKDGTFQNNSSLIEAIRKDPVLSKVKLIAEPWDLTTHQTGNFPPEWAEWYDYYRDTMRKFLRNDSAQRNTAASRICGSQDIFDKFGKKPYHSINFITCHDGFTLYDLFSYTSKHNEANKENNRDGSNENYSCNCGIEGETSRKKIISKRQKMCKNAFCCLYLSIGTPMVLGGDEFLRTQRGNNNPYCQDNEISWFDWERALKYRKMIIFVSKCIEMRKRISFLQRNTFLTGNEQQIGRYSDIEWINEHGETLDWSDGNDSCLCYTIRDPNPPTPAHDFFLTVVMNFTEKERHFVLAHRRQYRMFRLIDTSQSFGSDFSLERKYCVDGQTKYLCKENSLIVFLSELYTSSGCLFFK